MHLFSCGGNITASDRRQGNWPDMPNIPAGEAARDPGLGGFFGAEWCTQSVHMQLHGTEPLKGVLP